MTTPQPYPHYPPPAQPQATAKFGALAWSALILGIIGVVGSPIPILDNVTAVGAFVGIILGFIALFGARKILALIGIALCVAAIVITIAIETVFVKGINKTIGEDPAAAAHDVTVTNCAVTNEGFVTSTSATILITNSTAVTQSYAVTISINNATGARIGEITAFSNSLAAGQTATLTGPQATGIANPDAVPGPATCVVANVDRTPA